jgi:RHS Repeat
MTQRLLLAGIAACVVLAGGPALAATASYQYDALGRLTGVTTSDGKVAT